MRANREQMGPGMGHGECASLTLLGLELRGLLMPVGLIRTTVASEEHVISCYPNSFHPVVGVKAIFLVFTR